MTARTSRLGLLFAITVLLCGCATNPYAGVFEPGSAVQVRSYQSRAFDTVDRQQVLRTVIATLQDLGFVIDNADAALGTVSATKLNGYSLAVTATVRPRGKTQTVVRLNARQGLRSATDPLLYQAFFAALEQAMFLTAHPIA